jgi:hypothetical protein
MLWVLVSRMASKEIRNRDFSRADGYYHQPQCMGLVRD